MSFRFIEDGPERGDCTAPYIIDLGNKLYTVEEFINEILVDHAQDWGFMKFVDMEGTCKFMLYYRYDELLMPVPRDISSWAVVKANAEGGQTRMDYTVTVKTPEDFEMREVI